MCFSGKPRYVPTLLNQNRRVSPFSRLTELLADYLPTLMDFFWIPCDFSMKPALLTQHRSLHPLCVPTRYPDGVPVGVCRTPGNLELQTLGHGSPGTPGCVMNLGYEWVWAQGHLQPCQFGKWNWFHCPFPPSKKRPLCLWTLTGGDSKCGCFFSYYPSFTVAMNHHHPPSLPFTIYHQPLVTVIIIQLLLLSWLFGFQIAHDVNSLH